MSVNTHINQHVVLVFVHVKSQTANPQREMLQSVECCRILSFVFVHTSGLTDMRQSANHSSSEQCIKIETKKKHVVAARLEVTPLHLMSVSGFYT